MRMQMQWVTGGWSVAAIAIAFTFTSPEASEPGGSRYADGVRLLQQQEYAGAEREFRAVLEDEPGALRASLNLARALLGSGKNAEALALTEALVRKQPDSTGALFLHGRSLFSNGRPAEAIPVLRESLAIDDRNGHAWNLLGYAHLVLGEDEEALEALEHAAELLPDTPYVWNNLGIARERTGRLEDAAEAYRSAEQAAPGDPKPPVNLARVLAAMRSRTGSKSTTAGEIAAR